VPVGKFASEEVGDGEAGADGTEESAVLCEPEGMAGSILLVRRLCWCGVGVGAASVIKTYRALTPIGCSAG
jgi:hypothetical protein